MKIKVCLEGELNKVEPLPQDVFPSLIVDRLTCIESIEKNGNEYLQKTGLQ